MEIPPNDLRDITVLASNSSNNPLISLESLQTLIDRIAILREENTRGRLTIIQQLLGNLARDQEATEIATSIEEITTLDLRSALSINIEVETHLKAEVDIALTIKEKGTEDVLT
jgi:hypothetical protein